MALATLAALTPCLMARIAEHWGTTDAEGDTGTMGAPVGGGWIANAFVRTNGIPTIDCRCAVYTACVLTPSQGGQDPSGRVVGLLMSAAWKCRR